VVQGFVAHARRFYGDREVLFQLALTRKIGETARPQAGFELGIFGLSIP
jgi:hypothetical protein